jgi:3-mercaptopyruvate sulfurtransferase SseA
MKRAGITNVSALYGGLDAWRNIGGQTRQGAQP